MFLLAPIWGRNRAPLPVPKSSFFSQLLTKNFHFEKFYIRNWFLVFFRGQTVLLWDNKAIKPNCNVLRHDLSTFQPFKHVTTFPNFLFSCANFPNSEGPLPFPEYWKGTLHSNYLYKPQPPSCGLEKWMPGTFAAELPEARVQYSSEVG